MPTQPEPLAYEILAATIPHHDVRIFDMRIDKKTLAAEIESFKPHVVATGGTTAGYYECVNVLKEARKADPRIITVAGGHHATVMPKDFHGIADYIVVGEGEKTFQELVDALERENDASAVQGLAISRNGDLAYTGQRPLIDLDATPLPDRTLTQRYRKHYYRGTWGSYAAIIGTRGCSFRCRFCCQWMINKGKYRVRSPEKIVEEISRLEEKYIDFFDDNSWENVRWAEELHDRLKEARVDKRYKLYGRTDLILKRPDLIEKWRSIGLEAILMGFESFRDSELKKLNKRNTVEKNARAAKILKELDVDVYGYFIIDPSYKREDFLAMRDHVRELEIEHPMFTVLTPFPGTVLYEELKDQILTHNYRYYDAMHAVIPTRLPGREFYDQYRELFLKIYPKTRLLKNLLRGKKMNISISQTIAMVGQLKDLRPVDASA